MKPSSTGPLLHRLRQLMLDQRAVPERLHAYIVPSCDAHNSEYLAARDERRAFVSNFTGSRGTAIVTDKKALLWTDGRYFTQAEQQLDPNWTLMRERCDGVPTEGQWLAKQLTSGQAVGVDPYLVPVSEWRRLEEKLDPAGIRLVPVNRNLIDMIWTDQPAYPENPVLPLDLRFAGVSWEEKVQECRKKIKEEETGCLVLTALDDVAWLLNLRGSDIQFNPVFFAYVALTLTQVHLFISDAQLTDELKAHLRPKQAVENGVQTHAYAEIGRFLEEQAKQRPTEKVWLPSGLSQGLATQVPVAQRHYALSPVCLMKSLKNSTELKGFVECHVHDAAALCMYFAWLEKNVGSGELDEMSAANQLEQFRAEQPNYVGLSFDTISAVGANAAIIHYKPTPETNRTLTTEDVYLVDSGGQYKTGTTDVTRTVHFGTPSDFVRECFTRVLKGQIHLSTTVFPEKIHGQCLDSLARTALWRVGLDYRHGTGHGVGSYLNVHEGPSGISFKPRADDPGLQENMVLSNEPGYYEEGKFGIRIENLVRVVKADTEHKFGGCEYLTFSDLTLVPIQQKMIDPKLLTAEEIEYLNNYHDLCREKVGSYLREQGKQEALNWLIRETKPIG